MISIQTKNGTFTIHNVISYNRFTDGRTYKHPNLYRAYENDGDRTVLLGQSPAGWRRCRSGNLYPTIQAALEDAK